jgi:hypothetical protein
MITFLLEMSGLLVRETPRALRRRRDLHRLVGVTTRGRGWSHGLRSG